MVTQKFSKRTFYTFTRSLIIVYAMIPLGAKASGLNEMKMLALCSQNQRCMPGHSDLIKQLQSQCEIEMITLDCQTLAEADPEIKSQLKRCDIASQCQEFHELQMKQYSICLQGYKNALIDSGTAVKDLALKGGAFISDNWTTLRKIMAGSQPLDPPEHIESHASYEKFQKK